MKKTILIVSMILCAATLFAQSSNHINRVETTVSVDTLIQPDMIELEITIRTPNTEGKRGLDAAQGKLISILKSEKIDVKEDLKISNSYSTKKTKAYDAMLVREFSITVNNISSAQNIIEQTYNQKVGQASISKIYTTKFKEYERGLTRKALLKAREEASFQAEVLGQKIGKAILISKQDYYGGVVRVTPYGSSDVKMMTGSIGAANTQPVIEIKDLKISISFSVHFILHTN